MPTRCARCVFGAPCPAPASYAGVLVCGPDLATAWQQHTEWAGKNPVIGATAYCQQCTQITWLADDTDPTTALVRNVIQSRRMVAASAGMQAVCAAR